MLVYVENMMDESAQSRVADAAARMARHLAAGRAAADALALQDLRAKAEA